MKGMIIDGQGRFPEAESQLPLPEGVDGGLDSAAPDDFGRLCAGFNRTKDS